jgi:ABC-type nitrate/sulfonate/bicarbonate transport system substrate-binding protein
MRQGSWFLAAKCLALVCASLQADVFAAPFKVRLAYPTRSMSLLHVQVAVEKGLFIKHGLDVEAILIRSAVSLPALLGNEIQ